MASPRALAAAVAAACAVAAASPQSGAETFRWSAPTGVSTMDPHVGNDTGTRNVLRNVFEGLVTFDRSLEVAPALAESWERIDERRWRFRLRDGVRFHEGGSFDADDVVFSYRRALQQASDIRGRLGGIETMEEVDARTVDVVTKGPSPTLLRELTVLMVLDRGWAEANGAADPADTRRSGVENHATRNANGTGPFRLARYETDTVIELVPFQGWWGTPQHNITRAVLTPIRSDATRVAALLAGQVDMIMPVPQQFVGRIEASADHAVVAGPEARVIFLGMDQKNDALKYGEASGNPFRDVRVRRAMLLAIDADLIRRTTMRGAARPAGTVITPEIEGFHPSLQERPAPDAAAARALLREAGYPDGFRVTLDCPNDRYVNDEQICQAVAGMLGRVGIRVDVATYPSTIYFGRINQQDTSFYLHGWGTDAFDAHQMINLLVRTRGAAGAGAFNQGNYSNPRVDELIAAAATELDMERRRELIREALAIHKDEVGVIPLHQQMLSWGARRSVSVQQRADDMLVLDWVRIGG
jgi:peptide/nickel transport system substrate-binding protein